MKKVPLQSTSPTFEDYPACEIAEACMKLVALILLLSSAGFTQEGKNKLVAAVKASFDFCTTALAKADDSKLNDNITWFDGKPRARAWAFVALASSWADHYGAAAMYLRLNGLLPPSAQKAKTEEKKPEEKKK